MCVFETYFNTATAPTSSSRETDEVYVWESVGQRKIVW